ncbi:MAG: type II CRISPR RNA-guided endonuclease Cas9, partial [Oscillospiraceae bacterium]
MKEKYFVGLDIGTNSVGAAVTDCFYHVPKFKGNAMWTSAVFDSANQSAERRMNRTARRRLDRRQQRRDLLIELMAPAVLPTDPDFFKRIRESALWESDKTTGSRFTYFSDEGYTDKEYHKAYPTIHHLICELMNDPAPHDPRLVFIACSYILTHRGHFLNEADKDKINDVLDIGRVFEELRLWFSNCTDMAFPFGCTPEEFGGVLTGNRGVQNRTKAFYDLLWQGRKPKSAIDDAVDTDLLIKLISGGKTELSKLFKNEEYAELENNKIQLSDAGFDEKEAELRGELGDDFGLIAAAKNIYDWSLLTEVLNGCESISEAKVMVYEKHREDLAALRRIVRKYCPEKYNSIFRTAKNKYDNYTSYSGNVSSAGRITDTKLSRCDQTAFCDFLKKELKNVVPEPDDKEYERVIAEITEHSFCPRQVNTDNRVIPYQLYYTELKAILANAKKYIPQLNATDEYGSAADKILQLMTFRIPYYVGPLTKKNGNDNAWIVRRGEGRILPWNFDELVDKDRCEDEFIRRMTCKCTYIAGRDVLPKNSLLYCKFTVLNEINNIKINGDRRNFSVEAKQKVYSMLFEKQRKVTVKNIRELLISEGFMKPGDTLGGIDNTVKSSLRSQWEFRNLLAAGVLTENDVEEIIERLTCTTDTARFRKWLEKFGLSTNDMKYVGRLKYTDFGRLSRELLTEICDIDPQTGEMLHPNIITMMWENNLNLMELLSQNYGYRRQIESMNREYYSDKPRTLDERMSEMYIPSAVRRPVKRAVEMVREYKAIMGRAPERIFIEMARELTDPDNKGKRTSSRRETIQKYFNAFPQEETEELRRQLESRSDDELRSEKLYLYFIQLGKCMYSGKSIELESLGSKLYDVDHIFPQSRVKDDSLENKALVLSDLNGAKSDKYPISEEIRQNMRGFWDKLHKNGLIGDKKYERLTRSTPFTDEELAGFISRQLVETRQSTKAVAQLLKEQFPESEIVYVKAGLASDFRKEYKLFKCRELNDLHHAKDAYLNIVMGNIYHVKFTRDPMNFVKEYRDGKAVFDLKIESLLTHDVIRNGETAWKGDGSWLKAVKNQLEKNNIRFVRYTFRRKGALFNLMPERKAAGLVPRKDGLDTEKYGGYNSTTASFFSLVKYRSEKTSGVAVIPVELMYSERFEHDAEFAERYALEVLGDIVSLKSGDSIRHAEFPLGSRILKINTLIEIDGFRAFMTGKDSGGKYIGISSANPLLLNNEEVTYFKRLLKINERIAECEKLNRTFTVSPEHDKVTSEENMQLYDQLCSKVNASPFRVLFSNMGTIFTQGR